MGKGDGSEPAPTGPNDSHTVGRGGKGLKPVRAAIDTHLCLHVDDLGPEGYARLKRAFTRDNPEWWKKKRLGFWAGDTPRQVEAWRLEDQWMMLPRGAVGRIAGLLEKEGLCIGEVWNRTVRHPAAGLEFQGTLYGYQRQAVDAIVDAGGGIVRGPCGSGKTVVLLAAIAAVDQPTIVIVHSSPLMQQWKQAVVKWLGVPAGSIGGGKKAEIQPVTIAMQQTVWRCEGALWLRDFGMVVADECFVDGTPVLMADGTLKQIEDVEVGDEVAIGGRVTKKFSRLYSGNMVYLNGHLTTANHPVATSEGWIRTSLLRSDDFLWYDPIHEKRKKKVCGVRQSFEKAQSSEQVQKTRVRRLRRADRKMSTVRCCDKESCDERTAHPKCARSWSVEQRTDQRRREGRCIRECQDRNELVGGKQGKVEGHHGEARSEREVATCHVDRSEEKIFKTGRVGKIEESHEGNDRCRKDHSLRWQEARERSIADDSRNGDAGTIGTAWVHSRVCRQDEDEARFRIPDKLQGRSSESRIDDCGGDRWKQPREKVAPRSRREEGLSPNVNRLEGAALPGSVRLRQGNRDVHKSLLLQFQQVNNLETENCVYVAAGVLVHNCHRFAARTFDFAANLFPAAHRVGASADEQRKDQKQFLIYDTFGEVVHKITRKQLEELDRLMPIRMEVVPTGFTDEDYVDSVQHGEVPDWTTMIDRLTSDAARNDLVLRHVGRVLAEGPGNRVLVLSERVDACRKFAAALRGMGVSAGLMLGGTGNRDELAETKAGILSGDVRVAVATKVADEGLDLPPLTHVFLTCPVHSHPKRLEQMVGRAARKHPGKDDAVAVYFWDRALWPGAKCGDESKFLRQLSRPCSGYEVLG